MTVGNLGGQPLAQRRPSSERLHVGLNPGLVDEDQPRGVDPVLALGPLRPATGDVGPIALAGDDGFF